MDHRPDMLPKVRSEDLMRAMAGYPCTLRVASFVPGLSCAAQATVVGCHLPVFGKGIGTKVTDLAVAAGCAACHDIVDGRNLDAQSFIHDRYPTAFVQRLLNGLVETHAMLVRDGIVQISNGRLI